MIYIIIGTSFGLSALVFFTVAGILNYKENEKELRKKAQKKYNPKAGWYAYC